VAAQQRDVGGSLVALRRWRKRQKHNVSGRLAVVRRRRQRLHQRRLWQREALRRAQMQ